MVPCQCATLRRISDYVARDAPRIADTGRGGWAGAVATACDRADLRPRVASAVLLLKSRRRRRPDRGLVFKRRDLETSRDHAVGIYPCLRHRFARRRRGRLLVRAPAAGRCRVRSLCEDGQRIAARGARPDLCAVAWAWHLVQ